MSEKNVIDLFCGAGGLLSIIRYYGGDISLDRLTEMTKTTKRGIFYAALYCRVSWNHDAYHPR